MILSDTAGSSYDETEDWDVSPPVDIFRNFTGNQQVLTLSVQTPPQPVTPASQMRPNDARQHNGNQVQPSSTQGQLGNNSAPIPFQTSDPEAMRYIGILTAETKELKRRLDLADKIAPKKLKESQRKDGEGEYDDPDYASEDNWIVLRGENGQLCKDDGVKRLELMSLRMKLRPPNAGSLA